VFEKVPYREREKAPPPPFAVPVVYSFVPPTTLIPRSDIQRRVTGGFGDQTMLGCVGGCSLFPAAEPSHTGSSWPDVFPAD